MADETPCSRLIPRICHRLSGTAQSRARVPDSEFLPSNDAWAREHPHRWHSMAPFYAAEYVMRMSSVPSMLVMWMHALTGTGRHAVNTHYTDVQRLPTPAPPSTRHLNFGFFHAQPQASRCSTALRNATLVDATTVTGRRDSGRYRLGQIPPLYAQATPLHRPAKRGHRE